MNQFDGIALDPSIRSGQPTVHDTCVLVRLILGYLAHGETTESILRDFPSISEEDVRTVVAFAARAAAKGEPLQAGVFQPEGLA
jgi:uncharacterized protein (DUF433 family)